MKNSIKTRLKEYYDVAKQTINEVMEEGDDYNVEIKVLQVEVKSEEDEKWLPAIVVNIILEPDKDSLELCTINHITTVPVTDEIWERTAELLEAVTENALMKDDSLMWNWKWGTECNE